MQAYIVREYSLVPASAYVINVTSNPSKEHKGLFAFVNGIELILMLDIFSSVQLVGFEDRPVAVKASSLQMITMECPTNDPVLRNWYDDTPLSLWCKCRGCNLDKQFVWGRLQWDATIDCPPGCLLQSEMDGL